MSSQQLRPYPVAVRTSTQQGRDLHRPDGEPQPDEHDPEPACTTSLKTGRATWIWVREVTGGVLAFGSLCSLCYPVLGHDHRCRSCGTGELEHTTTILEDGLYTAEFSCTACEAAGAVSFRPATADVEATRGAALRSASTLQQHRDLVADGGEP